MSPNADSARTPPLDGLLVADFSRVLAGPLASMYLADLGATVVKVERSETGDDTRRWGPPYVGATSTYFASVNRNKQSLDLDLTDPGDAELARRLAARADVVIENFRVGALTRFGLDPAAVRAANPRAVYCSISGFGSGAGADLPGYDFVVQALGGLMSITGQPGAEPTKVGVAVVDVLTGLHATIAIQAALRERDRSGLGQHVEVNLLSSLLSSLVNQGSAYVNGGGVPGPMGNRHPSIAPYETLATKDGSLAVAIGNDRQFATMAAVLGRPGLAEDPAFATNHDRVLNRAELIPALEALLRDRTTAEWTAEFRARGLPCGKVNDLAEAIGFATELGLDPVVTLPDGESGIATLASPLRLHDTPVRYHRAPPALGADSAELRAWLADAEAPRLPDRR
ncbi:CoA transferase [Amycolatopsis sp. OK19-0408]|uniref:CoA transferase n=1 Tax=Amycolatopsis iheyensis TaxID=2945988 RepID=A0A9X2N9S0_9PSEU|nr:CoA transferase [Amycolatopsis iheyensis]MCR6483035.1 CoA transferase [Amycolatopsis iheyensis]